jgi:Ca-activated chloride channel family protein
MRAGACLVIALQAVFSVRTEMVVLPVTVTDARGHSVAGLTIADFRVYDDGRLQPITMFKGGQIPITLGLVVDHSQSMSPKIAAVNAAMSAFARTARPDDELFVVGFNHLVRIEPLKSGRPFTSDHAELDAALTAEKPGGPTALYDAVAAALQHLGQGRSERKALIVLSDGGDNASRMKYGEVRKLARASQVVIYGIGLLGAGSQDEDPEILKRLCRDNGGTAHFPTSPTQVPVVLDEIARNLREQYTIGFAPGAGNPKRAYHAIKVTAMGPEGESLRVRTRTGYAWQGIAR